MAKKKTHEQHCKELNADREHAALLACSIFPGDGFLPDKDADIAAMLLGLLSIVSKYDDPDDREWITYRVAEAIYPTTFKGQGAIDAYIKNAVRSAQALTKQEAKQ
jgi:hypothetical protein